MAAAAFHQRLDERRRSLEERGFTSSNNKHSSNNGWTPSSRSLHDSRNYNNEEPRRGNMSASSRYSDRRTNNEDWRRSRREDEDYYSTGYASQQQHKSEPINEKRQHRPPNSYARDGNDRDYSLITASNSEYAHRQLPPNTRLSMEEKRRLRDDNSSSDYWDEPSSKGWGVASGRDYDRYEEDRRSNYERSDRYEEDRRSNNHRWKDDDNFRREDRSYRDDRGYNNHRNADNNRPRYYEEDRRREAFGREDRGLMRDDGRDRAFLRKGPPQYLKMNTNSRRSDSFDSQRKNFSRPATKTSERPSRQEFGSDRDSFDSQPHDKYYGQTRPVTSVDPAPDRYQDDRHYSRPSVASKPRSKGPSFMRRMEDRVPPTAVFKSEPTSFVQPRVAASVKKQVAMPVAPPSKLAPVSVPPKRSLEGSSERASPPKKRFCPSTDIPSATATKTGDVKMSTETTTPAIKQEPTPAATLETSAVAACKPVVAPTPMSKTESKSSPPKPLASTVSSKKPSPPQKPAITAKLGIPMRWLKPAAKPKKPPAPKKTPTPTAAKATTLGQIPRKSNSNSIANQASSNSRLKIDATKTNSAMASKAAIKAMKRPTTPPNRLVTDASEGSSTLSNHLPLPVKNKMMKQKVPVAIVTKKKNVDVPKKPLKTSKSLPPKSTEQERVVPKTKKLTIKLKKPSSVSPMEDRYAEPKEEEWHSDEDSDSESEIEMESDSESESEMSEDETERWAEQLLGRQSSPIKEEELSTPERKKFRIRLSLKKFSHSPSVSKDEDDVKDEPVMDEKERAKLEKKQKKELMKKKASIERSLKRQEYDEEKARKEMEEERRKREEAKPLTAAEIKAILGEDDFGGGNQSSWVRRSSRKPSAALLNSKPVKTLIAKLRYNDPEMKVLKMKKFIADPNAPSEVLDAALNAMEENSNCEALYIQNFNEGMRDQQVLHLIRILQQPSCKIWCLNIGENYNVGDDTWEKFTKGLVHTKITHMYASEHTITGEMKDEIRETIRENRKKHNMHNDPNNLDVIIQCTHCWWNPVNAKVLRPYLKKKGYEHILNDKEAQGLQGSSSAAPVE